MGVRRKSGTFRGISPLADAHLRDGGEKDSMALRRRSSLPVAGQYELRPSQPTSRICAATSKSADEANRDNNQMTRELKHCAVAAHLQDGGRLNLGQRVQCAGSPEARVKCHAHGQRKVVCEGFPGATSRGVSIFIRLFIISHLSSPPSPLCIPLFHPR